MIRLVVFDMAGTTVEDRDFVHQALIEAMGAFGCWVTRNEVNDVMGYPKPVAISQLLQLKKHNASPLLVEEIHDRFVDIMVRFYEHDDSVKAKEWAGETFQLLRDKGIMVALDTGFNRKIADTIIRRLGWDQDLIDYSVTSDEVKQGRPHPDMIFKAMKLAGISSSREVMKVGDTLSDLQEGQAAGCRYVVGIITGAFTREQLSRGYHTHLIDDLRMVDKIVS